MRINLDSLESTKNADSERELGGEPGEPNAAALGEGLVCQAFACPEGPENAIRAYLVRESPPGLTN